MTAKDMARLKRYMQVDHDDDDELIETLWKAALEYMQDGGMEEALLLHEKNWLAVAGLTLFWYDHGRDEPDNTGAWPAGLRQIINQIKLKNGVV